MNATKYEQYFTNIMKSDAVILAEAAAQGRLKPGCSTCSYMDRRRKGGAPCVFCKLYGDDRAADPFFELRYRICDAVRDHVLSGGTVWCHEHHTAA